MLSSESHAHIYYGVRIWIWWKVLTLEHILPRKSKTTYDCIKAKIINRYVNFLLRLNFKNTSENNEKKWNKGKRGEILMHVISRVKALKMFNLLHCT